MAKALVIGDQIRELPMHRPFEDANRVNHPPNVLSRWSENDLKSIGVYTIQEDEIPEGYRVTGSSMTFVNGVVKRERTFEPIPAVSGEDLKNANRDQAMERILGVQHWYLAGAEQTFQNWQQMTTYMQTLMAIALDPPDRQITWPRFPTPVLRPNIRP